MYRYSSVPFRKRAVFWVIGGERRGWEIYDELLFFRWQTFFCPPPFEHFVIVLTQRGEAGTDGE